MSHAHVILHHILHFLEMLVHVTAVAKVFVAMDKKVSVYVDHFVAPMDVIAVMACAVHKDNFAVLTVQATALLGEARAWIHFLMMPHILYHVPIAHKGREMAYITVHLAHPDIQVLLAVVQLVAYA